MNSIQIDRKDLIKLLHFTSNEYNSMLRGPTGKSEDRVEWGRLANVADSVLSGIKDLYLEEPSETLMISSISAPRTFGDAYGDEGICENDAP